MQAPDYAEPLVGWRAWEVIDLEGELRLCSLAFWTAWQPREAVSARCRRSREAWSDGLRPLHPAPSERCSCGVYATKTCAQAAPYLSRLFRGRTEAVHRVIGRVSLWGTVVEASRGWRAASAYPLELYVPSARPRLRAVLAGLRRPSRPPAEVALALAAYGVPVELVDCSTPGEVAAALEPGRPGDSAERLLGFGVR